MSAALPAPVRSTKTHARRADDADLDVGVPVSSGASTAEMIANLLKSLPLEERARLLADVHTASIDGSGAIKQEKTTVKKEPARAASSSAAAARRSALASADEPSEESAESPRGVVGHYVAASGKGKVLHTRAVCGPFKLMPARMRDTGLKVCQKCEYRDAKQ